MFYLKFFINNYEGLLFKNAVGRIIGSCDSPKYEALDIYIWKILIQNIHTNAKKDIANLLCRDGIFKPKATGGKLEINIFNWMTLNTIP